MSPCRICGQLTELWVNQEPVCIACDGASRESLLMRLAELEQAAQKEHLRLMQQFNEIVSDIPSGIPHPDGTERIERARRELQIARERYREARERTKRFMDAR
jgi:hypothetical protein